MAGRNNLTTTTTGGIDEKRPPPSNLSLFLTFPAASAATKRATTTRVSDSVVSMSCGDMVARALERRGKGERMSLFSFGDRREESEKSEAATLASKLFFPSHSLPLSLPLPLSLSHACSQRPSLSQNHGPSRCPIELCRLVCCGEAGEHESLLHRKREKKRRKEDEVSRESFLRSCVGYFFFFPLCLPLTLPLFETKTQADFERRADPKSSEAAALLEEMRAHVKRVRESFSPQRAFSFPPFFLAASPQEL